VTLLGCLAVPTRCNHRILSDTTPIGVRKTEIELSLGKPLRRCPQVPIHGHGL
ncbi:uncharacterized protein METZ01_LOCUS252507, partial [marine metagenome]